MHIETGEWAVFNGANSTDDIGIVNWTWFFIYDDRERTLFGEETTFHFDEPGSYSVRLTVWDAAGNQNSTVFLVTVGDIVVPDTHTPSRLEGWIWAVAGLAFVFALVVILGFIKRVTPRRPPGEDPYHHTYR